ncbi:mediator of RNA polymerase II transcription subunit 30-like isoform X2 [Homarus americanus]|uniref:mediator of RNA polymerase II transcription subunit 30-like isoform X2 n=1 Tax=Homarus americanus TaxID=6706 RepID=UPI001C45C78F|nr:mediator of RNA polymerase II transcription subunit 30-like isoform X2 [Homarus americanus]
MIFYRFIVFTGCISSPVKPTSITVSSGLLSQPQHCGGRLDGGGCCSYYTECVFDQEKKCLRNIVLEFEMAMSGSSPAMMRGSYTGQMVPTSQSGSQGVQQGGGESSQTQPHPQRNTSFLCKAGCEAVQEIVLRTSEVFSHLKNMPLPNGSNQGTQLSTEKKMRIQENLSAIQRHFKPLRAIYIRVNDDCAGMEYTHIEDEADNRADYKKIGENYRHLVEESRELKEQLYLKARYMKEIIDQLRTIIWEVNTMLAMSNT